MRMHERERRVIADGADVAEMVCQPLELGHQRAQIVRARRRFDVQRGLDCPGEGDPVRDGAVAGGARGKLRRALDRRARHQRFDAFVHVAQALFEPHHRLARGGKAEMSRLDDAGMDRAYWNLVQVFAFHRQEYVGGARIRRRHARAERMLHVPKAEIEPRPRVRRADRFESVKAMNGAFEPDRRRM